MIYLGHTYSKHVTHCVSEIQIELGILYFILQPSAHFAFYQGSGRHSAPCSLDTSNWAKIDANDLGQTFIQRSVGDRETKGKNRADADEAVDQQARDSRAPHLTQASCQQPEQVPAQHSVRGKSTNFEVTCPWIQFLALAHTWFVTPGKLHISLNFLMLNEGNNGSLLIALLVCCI